MSYTGFFADEDLYEVAKNGDPEKGSWVVPVTRADHLSTTDFVTDADEATGEPKPVAPREGHLRLPARRPRAPAVGVVLHARGADQVRRLAGARGTARPGRRATTPRADPRADHLRARARLGRVRDRGGRQLAAEYLKRQQEELRRGHRRRPVPGRTAEGEGVHRPSPGATAWTSTRPRSSWPRSRCGSTPWSPACRPRGSACTCAAATR